MRVRAVRRERFESPAFRRLPAVEATPLNSRTQLWDPTLGSRLGPNSGTQAGTQAGPQLWDPGWDKAERSELSRRRTAFLGYDNLFERCWNPPGALSGWSLPEFITLTKLELWSGRRGVRTPRLPGWSQVPSTPAFWSRVRCPSPLELRAEGWAFESLLRQYSFRTTRCGASVRPFCASVHPSCAAAPLFIPRLPLRQCSFRTTRSRSSTSRRRWARQLSPQRLLERTAPNLSAVLCARCKPNLSPDPNPNPNPSPISIHNPKPKPKPNPNPNP